MNQEESGTAITPTEIIPSSNHLADGKFAPGNAIAVGRPKNSMNKITKVLKEQLAARLEQTGEAGNPLLFLHDFMMDPTLHPALRLQAADKLLRYVAPRLLQVDLGDSGGRDVNAEVTVIRERLREFIYVKREGQ